MRIIVAGHVAVTAAEFVELALGTPLELWLGVDGETTEERAARESAARDILADDPGLADRTAALAVDAIGQTMPELLRLAPARPTVPARRRRPARKEAAA